jgi:hypothetical protein
MESKPRLMRFGKYKGTPVSEIPFSYAQWLLDKMKEQIWKEGFQYDQMHLGPALMKVVFTGDIDEEVNRLITLHKQRYKSFDSEGFKEWLGDRTDRKLRMIWLGIKYYTRMRRQQAYINSLAESD